METQTILITASVAGIIYFLFSKQNDKNINNSKRHLRSNVPQHRFNIDNHKPNKPISTPPFFMPF